MSQMQSFFFKLTNQCLRHSVRRIHGTSSIESKQYFVHSKKAKHLPWLGNRANCGIAQNKPLDAEITKIFENCAYLSYKLDSFECLLLNWLFVRNLLFFKFSANSKKLLTDDESLVDGLLDWCFVKHPSASVKIYDPSAIGHIKLYCKCNFFGFFSHKNRV